METELLYGKIFSKESIKQTFKSYINHTAYKIESTYSKSSVKLLLGP